MKLRKTAQLSLVVAGCCSITSACGEPAGKEPGIDSTETKRSEKIRINTGFAGFLEGFPLLRAPLAVDDSLVRSMDTTRELSKKEFSLLQLDSLPLPYGDHYKEIVVGRVDVREGYHGLVLLQYYRTESMCRLIIYDQSGSLKDQHRLYYDNAEGNLWAYSKINPMGIIVVKEGNIYKNDGEETADTLAVSDGGSIRKLGAE